MSTVLYCRCSSSDQSVSIQLDQARALGYEPDIVIADEGISGVSTKLFERFEGRRLLDLRSGDLLLIRWLDRLSRSYTDCTEALRYFMSKGIEVRTLINGGMSFSGTTANAMERAIRDSMINFLAALGEAQAEATRESQRYGIQAAKQRGSVYLGRKPSLTTDQFHHVQQLLLAGNGVSEIAKLANVSRQVVYRTMKEPEKLAAALARWNM